MNASWLTLSDKDKIAVFEQTAAQTGYKNPGVVILPQVEAYTEQTQLKRTF